MSLSAFAVHTLCQIVKRLNEKVIGLIGIQKHLAVLLIQAPLLQGDADTEEESSWTTGAETASSQESQDEQQQRQSSLPTIEVWNYLSSTGLGYKVLPRLREFSAMRCLDSA